MVVRSLSPPPTSTENSPSGWPSKRSSDAPLATLSWTVPCIDDVRLHRLRNYTGNVSRKKAFLSREGLRCYDAQRCVRGVVDGFATAREVSELRDALAPKAVRPPHGGPASGLL